MFFLMEGVSFYKKLCLKIWIWRCNIGLNFSFKKKTWHWIWRCEVTVKLEDAMLLWNSADLIYPVRLNQSRNFVSRCCWCLAAGNWKWNAWQRWGCDSCGSGLPAISFGQKQNNLAWWKQQKLKLCINVGQNQNKLKFKLSNSWH